MRQLIDIRRYLHANPEISGEEKETSAFIYKELKENANADELVLLDCHAVIAIFRGKEEGKTTMIRADMDALPIQEINSFEHKSKVHGKSHKCGHDGHTTILIGLARQLSQEPPKRGKVILLFQPAEESGEGAKSVMADPFFQKLQINMAFALHNIPGYKKHQIIVREKQFTPHVISMIIKLEGRTAHAAEPENGENPALAISHLLIAADEMTNNNDELNDFILITPVHMEMGEMAYGISAGEGELHLTIRAWRTDLVRENCRKLEELAGTLATKYQLKASIDYLQEFAANLNADIAIEKIRNAAATLDVLELQKGVKWGEDFGLFTQHIPGAMFGLGSGEDCPALHNPDYDFPDEITETGVNMFEGIVRQING